MPANIKDLAKKAGKEKEAEKLWKKAVKIAEEEKGKKEKDFKDSDFAYAMGVFKNMLGIKESKMVEDTNKEKEIENSGNTALKEKAIIDVLEHVIIDLKKFGVKAKVEDVKAGSILVLNPEQLDRAWENFVEDFSDEYPTWGISWDQDNDETHIFVGDLKSVFPEKSFLESDLGAREWLEETMTSGSATSVGLPENPGKKKIEDSEKDDRDLIEDDRDPLDK